MPKVEQIVCDRCGTVKQESNNWWFVSHWQLAILIEPLTADTDKLTPAFPDPKQLYICGEACVAGALSGFMAGVHQKSGSANQET